MTSVAVIGTAGRDKDRTYDLDLWCKMWDDACKRFSPGKYYHLVSGGAAWADHLAVELFLAQRVSQLTLHFPAPFERGRFCGKAGEAANFYHKRFTEATGIDSLRQLREVIERTNCAHTQHEGREDYAGMFARNDLIAKESEACLAYSWGTGDKPADGGTKYTWDRIQGRKVHVSLSKL